MLENRAARIEAAVNFGVNFLYFREDIKKFMAIAKWEWKKWGTSARLSLGQKH
jgi:hypothetical protein